MCSTEARRYLNGYVVADNMVGSLLPRAPPLNPTFSAGEKNPSRPLKDPVRRPMSVGLGCEVPGLAPITPDTRHKLNQQVSIGTRLACGHSKMDRPTKRMLAKIARQEASKFEKPTEIDLSKETFIADLKAKGKDQAYIDRLEREFDIMLELNGQLDINEEWTAAMHKVGGFIKEESYPNFKVPRNICAASDAHKVFFGPWFNLIERMCKHSPHSVKAIPVTERVEYVKQRLESLGITFAATDHTRFESGLSREWIEIIIINFMRPLLEHLPGYKVFEYHLLKIARLKKVDFMEWFFFLEATQFSGTRFTSFWNWLCNMFGIRFVAKMSGAVIDFICEGDDAIIAEISGLMDPKWYINLCQDVKFERFERLGDASFVGNLYSETGQILKDPWKIAINFGWSTSQYTAANKRTLKTLARSKAHSILAEVPGCPIIAPMAHKMLALTKDVSDSQEKIEKHMRLNDYDRQKLNELRRKEVDINVHPKITLESRLDFERLFGIPLSMQLYIEEAISKKIEYGPLEELLPMFEFMPDNRRRDNETMWDHYTHIKIEGVKMCWADSDYMQVDVDYIAFLAGGGA